MTCVMIPLLNQSLSIMNGFKYMNHVFQGNSIDEGSPPEDLSDHQIELVPGVVFDNPPFGHQFGDCKLQPPSAVQPGDTVTVKFVSGTIAPKSMDQTQIQEAI